MTHAYAHPHPGRGRCGPGHRQATWEDVISLMAHHRGGRHGRRGGGFGPGGPGGRGPRARRGDVRTAMLLLLAEEPRNGYGLMQEIEERSGGAWRPSPGSVYPALSQLEDEGLVRAEQAEGGRHFVLTDEGRTVVDERPDDAPAPWAAFEEGTGARDLRDAFSGLAGAFKEVFRTGDEAQRVQAVEILLEARRSLYRLLADGDDERE